jgi:hypothetical protein
MRPVYQRLASPLKLESEEFRLLSFSRRFSMPEKKTIERAQEAAREHKSAGTQAGDFVREEINHIREGKHGARSTKQAIAIGLSKARRARVKLKPPKKGTTSDRTRAQAARGKIASGSSFANAFASHQQGAST